MFFKSSSDEETVIRITPNIKLLDIPLFSYIGIVHAYFPSYTWSAYGGSMMRIKRLEIFIYPITSTCTCMLDGFVRHREKNYSNIIIKKALSEINLMDKMYIIYIIMINVYIT